MFLKLLGQEGLPPGMKAFIFRLSVPGGLQTRDTSLLHRRTTCAEVLPHAARESTGSSHINAPQTQGLKWQPVMMHKLQTLTSTCGRSCSATAARSAGT